MSWPGTRAPGDGATVWLPSALLSKHQGDPPQGRFPGFHPAGLGVSKSPRTSVPGQSFSRAAARAVRTARPNHLTCLQKVQRTLLTHCSGKFSDARPSLIPKLVSPQSAQQTLDTHRPSHLHPCSAGALRALGRLKPEEARPTLRRFVCSPAPR